MNAPVRVSVELPSKFKPLLNSTAMYKVFYGGRSGAKSWQFARALIIKGLKGIRWLCARQTQSSLRESVYQLMIDQIRALGLGPVAEGGSGHYHWTRDEIRGPCGTLFMFKGLNDPGALKSLESCDGLWIEEADKVTKLTWQVIDPTIRKQGAEVWISFNPNLETDYLYDLFVKNPPPPNSIVVKVTFRDNPYLSDKTRTLIATQRAKNYDDYLWIWEGFCRVALEGAVYANELRAAQNSERICQFAMVPGKPIQTFWDLGRADKTAIWFVQLFGMENRIIRYYEANGHHISHYIDLLESLKADEHYTFGTVWLPHDGDEKRLANRRTIRQQIEDAKFRCKIVPKISVAEGINAARGVFPNCYFHATDAAEGINQLRLYHYEVDEKTGIRSKNPKHDDSSNGADAFRYMGVALRVEEPPKKKMQPKRTPAIPSGRHSWLGR